MYNGDTVNYKLGNALPFVFPARGKLKLIFSCSYLRLRYC